MKKIKVTPYTPERYNEWQSFLKDSNNGTIFHDQDFLSYHPEGRFHFEHLMFYEGDSPIAILPGGFREDKTYRSPMGATFGGFVTPDDFNLKRGNETVKKFLEYIKERDSKGAVLTPPLTPFSSHPDEVIDYSLIYNGFTQYNPLYSSIIDTHTVKDRGDLHRKIRYNIRYAEKCGLEVREEESLDASYGILVKNKLKFNTAPTHSLEELRYLKQVFPERIVNFTGWYDSSPIASLILFLLNQRSAIIFYNSHLYNYRKIHATNNLVERAINFCSGRGIRWLDFGVSADTFSSNPLEPSWPLIKFKESMGARGWLRRNYSICL